MRVKGLKERIRDAVVANRRALRRAEDLMSRLESVRRQSHAAPGETAAAEALERAVASSGPYLTALGELSVALSKWWALESSDASAPEDAPEEKAGN